jgi:glucose/arabinose dehydrogenase
MIQLRTLSQALILHCLLFSATLAQAVDYELETVTDGLEGPWSVALLPDDTFLVTLRIGRLIHVGVDGTQREVAGVPDTYYAGQGGFFDIVLHPDYDNNQLVYLSYAHGTPNGNGTAILRARLDGGDLVEAERIFLAEPLKDTPQHYGGRLLFLPDGTLLVSTGDGFEYREAAQDIHSELGKVIRINDDGSVPADNPLVAEGANRVWTYGHRNTQGLALDGDSGRVYLHEHGPRGGDELNLLRPGTNYGWPAITYGVDYSGAYVSPFTEAEGMAQPLTYWVPSIAPSGLAWYGGDQFPEWRGDLFVGALVDKEVRRLELNNGEVSGEEALFSELGERIRDVRDLGDGFLYLLTDSAEGRLIRVRPADRAHQGVATN